MATRTVILDGLAAWTGGQTTRLRAFLGRFRRFDPDTRLVVLEENGNVSRLCPGEAGVEFVNVANRLSLGYGRAFKRLVWQYARLPRLARSLEADVYLSFSHDLPRRLPRKLVSIVGVANLAPFSSAARDAEVRLRARLRLALLKRRILSAAGRAGRVIALSQACRATLVRHGVDAGKISTIPNGVEPPAEPPRSEQDRWLWGRGLRRQFLLYVSHFYRYKNFERLVAAYASLPSEMRAAHDLVLAGEPYDHDYCDGVQLLARRLGVAEQVVIIPGVKGAELATLYRRCALFVYPSLVENSPNILLEAMAAGAPVLAGNLPPMPEFGGDAIDYFDPLSVTSIASAILGALSSPSRVATLRGAVEERARLYTWDAFTRGVVQLYSGTP